MKSILYLSYMNLGISGSIGIKKKIFSQIEEFERNGFSVSYIYIENSILKSNFIQTDKIKFDVEHAGRSLSKVLIEYEYSKFDYIYIRFGGFSANFIKLLKKMKTNNTRILIEIPTYPIIGEYRQKLKEAFVVRRYRSFLGYSKVLFTYPMFSRVIKKYVEAIVTFSKDKKIWGIKTIQTCNGVDTDNIPNISFPQRDKNEISLICVSSCVKWHGYDRVIEGLRLYYESPQELIIRLNIVGDGPETSFYKSLVNKYNLEKYVSFFGNLFGEDLNCIYKNSHIALDAMGRHRVGVYYNSSIKGKEYAFKGLPIISGVETELDRANDFPYYMRVPADDSPIYMEDVVSFMEKVESHENFHSEIHLYAVTHFSFNAAMRPIVEYINLGNYEDE